MRQQSLQNCFSIGEQAHSDFSFILFRKYQFSFWPFMCNTLRQGLWKYYPTINLSMVQKRIRTARPVDPKTTVNRAASTFQIQAQQALQSVPSILSKLSFIAKQNLHSGSDVSASCIMHHHYCESLFAWIQIESEKHKNGPQSDNNIFFCKVYWKREAHTGK